MARFGDWRVADKAVAVIEDLEKLRIVSLSPWLG